MSPLQAGKQPVMDATDLAKDALHVHIGLLVFFAAALVFRLPLRSGRPWQAALAVGLGGEIWDIIDTALIGAPPQFAANSHDVWNTMLWPTIITLLARGTRVMERR